MLSCLALRIDSHPSSVWINFLRWVFILFLGSLLFRSCIACTNSAWEALDSNCCNFHKSAEIYLSWQRVIFETQNPSLSALNVLQTIYGLLLRCQKKSRRYLWMQLNCRARHCHAMVIWPHNISFSLRSFLRHTFWSKSSIYHEIRGANGACPLGKIW